MPNPKKGEEGGKETEKGNEKLIFSGGKRRTREDERERREEKRLVFGFSPSFKAAAILFFPWFNGNFPFQIKEQKIKKKTIE